MTMGFNKFNYNCKEIYTLLCCFVVMSNVIADRQSDIARIEENIIEKNIQFPYGLGSITQYTDAEITLLREISESIKSVRDDRDLYTQAYVYLRDSSKSKLKEYFSRVTCMQQSYKDDMVEDIATRWVWKFICREILVWLPAMQAVRNVGRWQFE